MGHSQSKNKKLFLAVIGHMLESRGIKVSKKNLTAFYDFVLDVSLWLQLAWENANKLCKELIRPIHKTGTMQDYIKACIDASPAVVQGMTYAVAMKGQSFGSYIQQLNKAEPQAGKGVYFHVVSKNT